MKFLAQFLLVTSVVAPLSAATLTFSVPFGPGSINIPHSINVPQFDPNLGTITGIHFDLAGSKSMATFANTTSSAIIISSVQVGSMLSVQDTNGNTTAEIAPSLVVGSLTVPGATSAGPGLAVAPGVGSDAQTGDLSATTFVGTTSLNNAANMYILTPMDFQNLYIGTGTMAFSIFNMEFDSGNIPAGVYVSDETLQGTFAVSYNYVSSMTAPEPATLVLSGAALLAIVFLARRRL